MYVVDAAADTFDAVADAAVVVTVKYEICGPQHAVNSALQKPSSGICNLENMIQSCRRAYE
jgi:hypothetical protein